MLDEMSHPSYRKKMHFCCLTAVGKLSRCSLHGVRTLSETVNHHVNRFQSCYRPARVQGHISTLKSWGVFASNVMKLSVLFRPSEDKAGVFVAPKEDVVSCLIFLGSHLMFFSSKGCVFKSHKINNGCSEGNR